MTSWDLMHLCVLLGGGGDSGGGGWGDDQSANRSSAQQQCTAFCSDGKSREYKSEKWIQNIQISDEH